jgi:hypothetical protein
MSRMLFRIRTCAWNLFRQWTYQQYFQEAVTVAKAFIELGLDRHRTVAILGKDRHWAVPVLIKGIDRSFELRGKIRLNRFVRTNWRLGNFFYFILKGHHHKISKKPIDAA